MKKLILFHYFTATIACVATVIFLAAPVWALTAGSDYTISVEKFKSDGTLTSVSSGDSLDLSGSATADSTGKIEFSITGIPDSSACNFLIMLIKDSSGDTARQTIAPCPAPGETLPLGISGLTNSQTDAMVAAAAASGTDNPILVVFGLAIVRSTSASTTELALIATLASQGIVGTGGFQDYLTDNGVTTAQLVTYKSNIVFRLADSTSGYSKLIKDSVDATSDSAELDKRGEAASILLKVLIEAATTAGFSQDRVLEAFNAMGAIVVPLMNTAISNGTLSNATFQGIKSSIGGGLTKLKADRGIEKYSAALGVMGGTDADVTSYTTAATILINTMTTVFKAMEQVYDGDETQSEVSSANDTFGTAMNSAFNTFITDTAASDARITTMISNINTALGSDSGVSASNFKFYKSDGTQVNWPLTMVIITDWISTVITNSGSVSYTVDTTAIPSSVTWMGSCSDSSYFDQTSCEAAAGTWTAGRTDFSAKGISSQYASLFQIQEDIMILEFSRFTNQGSAGEDMSAQATLEKNFSNAMAAIATNISGTTDGSTAIGSSQKSAIVTLMQSPQF